MQWQVGVTQVSQVVIGLRVLITLLPHKVRGTRDHVLIADHVLILLNPVHVPGEAGVLPPEGVSVRGILDAA